MKKILICFMTLMTGISAFSQSNSNQLSLELGSGFSKPFSNKSVTGEGSFMAAPNLNLGVRYMFNSDFGLRGSFNYDSFEDKGIGSTQNRVNLEAYYNIGNWFDLSRASNSTIALYSHLGAGATFVNSKFKGVAMVNTPNREKQLNASFGVSPRIRLNDFMSIYTDLSYILAFKQHFNYSGEPIVNAGNSGEIGSHLTFNVGLSFSIGDNLDHVDFN